MKKEQERHQRIKLIGLELVGVVESAPHNFVEMSRYLKEDRKETQKLLEVTTYCFLAEKHNFNINEYYSEAFDLKEEEQPKKRLKKEKE